ncbi:uncharacterized protein AB675_5277 [Cyphellophora attinorum]|uniref:Uncharacterized protein n=1 Tax=Cyphellophora attinorum TaxID=1664694 RepID=A0A0N1H352_9EURO|nr:uncharacterized protein AB675_5277 [Phialophora attinorum]KPI39322.1 hypothetical protein AB675_5277 [Phialophora attinorum]
MLAALITVLFLTFASRIQAKIQITQPAPQARTLQVRPLPSLHWVYSSSDPPVLNVIIRQEPTDVNASPISPIRLGVVTSWGQVTLDELSPDKRPFKPGMNFTILVMDGTGSRGSDEEDALDRVGPLLLTEGWNGIVPVTSTSTNGGVPSAETSAPSDANMTLSSGSNMTITTTDTGPRHTPQDPFGGEQGNAEPPPPSATTTTSEAEKVFASTLYLLAIFMLGLPAFWLGLWE